MGLPEWSQVLKDTKDALIQQEFRHDTARKLPAFKLRGGKPERREKTKQAAAIANVKLAAVLLQHATDARDSLQTLCKEVPALLSNERFASLVKNIIHFDWIRRNCNKLSISPRFITREPVHGLSRSMV